MSHNFLFYSYNKIGVLKMLDENMRIKSYPQNINETNFDYDVIISLDSQSTESLLSRISSLYQLGCSKDKVIHFVHFPIKDELVQIKNACHHVAVLASMVRK